MKSSIWFRTTLLILVILMMVGCGSKKPPASPPRDPIEPIPIPNNVYGIVTNGRAGNAVEGVIVEAVQNGEVIGKTITSKNGIYYLEVPTGTQFDLIAWKDDKVYASARYQNVTVGKGESYNANIIIKKVLNPDWVQTPPELSIEGVEPHQAVSGPLTISFVFGGDNRLHRAFFDFGLELSYEQVEINNDLATFELDTTIYPDGESFIYLVAYDTNENSVACRIPIVIDNVSGVDEIFTMENPVTAYAITLGDNLQIDGVEQPKLFSVNDPLHSSRLSSSLKEYSIQSAGEKSACFIQLVWEPDLEYYFDSNFKGYKVYRSNSKKGPWRLLGMAKYSDNTEEWSINDTTPYVSPGVASYYKVVPISLNGTEGEGQYASVIPLGRFEVNLVSPANNVTVGVKPPFKWQTNGLQADLFYFEMSITDLSTDYTSSYEFEIENPRSSLFQFSELLLSPNRMYEWDLVSAEAAIIYNENSLAISSGMIGSASGSYNGAFVFTTGSN